MTPAGASSPPLAPRAGAKAVIRVNPFPAPETIRERPSRRDGDSGDDDDPWGFRGPIFGS
jgi:hypothetical protein